MKPKELFYLLGWRPKPRTYGFQINEFNLPKDGRVRYAQWLHPFERPKTVSQEVVDGLRAFLKAGDVAIDIGAHTGDTTLPIALTVGKTGCVLALEPNPYVFPVLKKNAELNPESTNIIPLMFAATPTDGQMEFEYSDPGFCNGGRHEGISPWRHGHAFKLKVQGRNLETYLRGHHPDLVERLSYIKVDAEGYDHTVLQSLAPLLRAARPYVKAEVFKRTNRHQRQRFFEFLSSLGYALHRVRDETHYRGERIGPEDVMRWPHFDVFCVPIEPPLSPC